MRLECPICGKLLLKDINGTMNVAASSDYVKLSTSIHNMLLETRCKCKLFCTIYGGGFVVNGE